MYWMSLPTGQAQLIAETMNPIWGPVGSAPAPTATGNPKDIQITPNMPKPSPTQVGATASAEQTSG
jgi:hypothetical protein